VPRREAEKKPQTTPEKNTPPHHSPICPQERLTSTTREALECLGDKQKDNHTTYHTPSSLKRGRQAPQVRHSSASARNRKDNHKPSAPHGKTRTPQEQPSHTGLRPRPLAGSSPKPVGPGRRAALSIHDTPRKRTRTPQPSASTGLPPTTRPTPGRGSRACASSSTEENK